MRFLFSNRDSVWEVRVPCSRSDVTEQRVASADIRSLGSGASQFSVTAGQLLIAFSQMDAGVDPLTAGVVTSLWGMFNLKPAPGAENIPRNYRRGPGYFRLNGNRAGGAGLLGEGGLHKHQRQGPTGRRHNLTLSIQVRNILNCLIISILVRNQSSLLFGMFTWLASAAGRGALGRAMTAYPIFGF